MAKANKFLTKTHISDVDGNLVAPGTEIDAALLGDADVIERYKKLEAIEDSVIVTGEADDEARAKAEAEAKAAAAENKTELKKLDRPELAEMAKAKGIEVSESDTKTEIIAKLTA